MSAFQLRPGTEADHPFIYSATTRSLWTSPYYRDVPAWPEVAKGVVARMLLAPWSVTIAYPKDLPDEIAGFVLHRAGQTHDHRPIPVIGVVYVKNVYRLLGVGRQLLEHATNREPDFLTVLATPKTLGMCRDRGLKPQLSPYFL